MMTLKEIESDIRRLVAKRRRMGLTEPESGRLWLLRSAKRREKRRRKRASK